MSRHSQTRKQRATAWTDLYRLFICALGFALIAGSTNGFFDEDKPWPLTAMFVCVGLGLVFIGIAIFAKPKTMMRL